jgi:hypothetical protein
VQASAIYNYTGNPFTVRMGTDSVFTGINISLTFDQPLPPSDSDQLESQAELLLDWHVSDGVLDYGPNLGGTLLACMFQTDASGKIMDWLVVAQALSSDGTAYQDGSAPGADVAGIFLVSYAFVTGSPGTWSQEGQVPEPGSFALVLGALAAAAAYGLRKSRRQPARSRQ